MQMSKVKNLRAAIEQASVSLSDNIAAYVPELFPQWKPDVDYAIGDRFQNDGILYKVLIAHKSQAAWIPKDTPSLYAAILIPDPSIIPEWVQPSSTNAYSIGDKVRHNGKIWTSNIDHNVWEPGVYGWDET